VCYQFAYDTELRLTQVTNPQGLTWDYVYDRAGRLVTESDFDEREITYTYDDAGQLSARTTPLGDTVTYQRDSLGRVVSKDASGALTDYTYDDAGRLIHAAAPGTSLDLEYDVVGRMLAETVDGRTTRYDYDELGRRTTRTTPTGAVSTFTYDSAGNRTSLSADGHRLGFTHDANGREIERTIGEAVTLASAWDPLGRLIGQHLVTNTRTQRARSYAYRPDSNLTSITEEISGLDEHVDLDPVGRPLAVTADGWSETYAYDSAGNQIAAAWPEQAGRATARGERTYTGTRIISAGGVRYEHDSAGRMTLRQKTRLSRKPDTWRYEWDAEDRLTACTTPDGTRWVYTYDALGRRTGKYRINADGSPVEATYFTWDGTRLAEQSDTATGVTLTWDHEGHRPLTQYERKTLTQDQVDSRFFAIVTDLVGRPTELVDETGHIAWHTRATLWGTTTWNKDATAYTPLRFPGQYADLETGLHHNYFRHYDPELGRFSSPDPLGLAPADNPVAYVASPLVWSDPLGLTPCKETFYRVMSKKEFDRLGPNGEINVRGENFVTQESSYVRGIAERFARRGGRNADKYTHLVQYEMEPGTRDALIAAGRGSGDNIAAVRSAYGIDLEEIGNSPDFVHVKMEREGLNFGLRSGSVDVFNSRIKSVSHELL
jgi:RHS repeat-associated protein